MKVHVLFRDDNMWDHGPTFCSVFSTRLKALDEAVRWEKENHNSKYESIRDNFTPHATEEWAKKLLYERLEEITKEFHKWKFVDMDGQRVYTNGSTTYYTEEEEVQ